MVLLVAAVLVAGLAAVRERRDGAIPLWLVAPAALLAPLAHAALALGRHEGLDAALVEAGASAGGAAICAAIPFLLYRKQALGGGDVVLFAALGAIGQPTHGLTIFLYALLAIVVLAFVEKARSGALRKVLANSRDLFLNALRSKEKRIAVEPQKLSWSRVGSGVFVGALVTLLLQLGRGGP